MRTKYKYALLVACIILLCACTFIFSFAETSEAPESSMSASEDLPADTSPIFQEDTASVPPPEPLSEAPLDTDPASRNDTPDISLDTTDSPIVADPFLQEPGDSTSPPAESSSSQLPIPPPPTDTVPTPIPLPVITEFAPLDEEVAEQTAKLGTSSVDLNLPQSLAATTEDAEGNVQEVTIQPIEWSSSDFNAEQPGTYTFTAVMPWEVPPENEEDEAQPAPFTEGEGVLRPSISITVEDSASSPTETSSQPTSSPSPQGAEAVPAPLVITAFVPLDAAVAQQEAMLGTPYEALNLPQTLAVTAEDTEGNVQEVALQPIVWSSIDFNAEQPGTYTFTATMPWETPPGDEQPARPALFTQAEDVLPPSITVHVSAPLVITAFAPLDEAVCEQEATRGTSYEDLSLPQTLSAIAEDAEGNVQEVTIQPIEWSSTDYNAAQSGVYTFTAVLPLEIPTAEEGTSQHSPFTLAEGVLPPTFMMQIMDAAFTPTTPFADIQDAIQGSTGNETFRFAAGTYVFPAAINIPASDITIQGAGAGSTIFVAGDTGYRHFTVDGSASATFQGLSLNGPTTPAAGAVNGGIEGGASLILAQCAFTGNVNHAGNGGGVGSHGSISLTGCDFTGNTAVSGGGISSALDAELMNCNIRNNTANFYGGGLYILGNLTITGGEISKNQTTASYGGGAYAAGTLTATGVRVIGNHSENTGGGLDSAGAMTLQGCTVTGNTAWGSGAGLYSVDSITVANTVISENHSTDSTSNGGGVRSFGILIATGCKITDNSAGQHGGGIASTGSSLTVTDCEIIGNTALGGSGGGLYGKADVHLTDCAVHNNTAVRDGGGIWAFSLTLAGGGLHDNTATNGNGGGIHVMGPLMLQNYHAIYGNKAGSKGGGIYGGSTVELAACTIRDNGAASGGGVYARREANMTASTLNNNTATASGGGVYAEAMAVLKNCTLYANRAADGGGAYVQGDAALTNCTLTLNTGSIGGLSAAGTMNLLGNIIAGNGAADATGLARALPTIPDYNLIGLPSITLADIFNSPTPVLTNNGGLTQTVMISNNGVAVDVMPAGSGFLATDQRGVSRPQGLAADVGAVEITGDHIITATAGPGGSISPVGTVQVADGGTATFRFLPSAGYVISRVLVDGAVVTVSGDSYTFSNVTRDHTIHVEFAPAQIVHVITATAGPGGSISPAGTVQVADGGTATFRFLPSAGYVISRVLVDGVVVTVSGDSYTFSNVTRDHTIHVEFKASPSGNGNGGGSGGSGGGKQTGDYSNTTFWSIIGGVALIGLVGLASYPAFARARRRKLQKHI